MNVRRRGGIPRPTLRLRVSGEPVADFGAFGVVGVDLENFQVMLARKTGLTELLCVKVRQGEVRPDFRRISLQDLLEFLRGIQRVTSLLEGEGKVIAGIDGFGLEGEGDFVG